MQKLHHIGPALVGASWFKKLLDVDWSTPPTDGQSFKWDDASQKLIPSTIATSGASGAASGVLDRSNSWFTNGKDAVNGGTSKILKGAVQLAPLIIQQQVSVDAWVFNLTANGGAGAKTDIVLYGAGTDGYPTSLTNIKTGIDTSVNGVKTGTITAAMITPGLYWLGLFYYSGANTTETVTGITTPGYTGMWSTLGDNVTYGQCEYNGDGSTTGLGTTGMFLTQAPGLADFDNGGRTAAPATFGTYTGRVNAPATTDNGTVNTACMVGLHVV